MKLFVCRFFSNAVKVFEVGPRDGLQNVQTTIEVDKRVGLINRLNACGLEGIEVGSMVSYSKVPQMRDSDVVFRKCGKNENAIYSLLVPNMRYLADAIAVGAKEVAVFASASESFSKKNINCSIDESMAKYREVVASALNNGIRVRGYLSCVVECPYDGYIQPMIVTRLAEKLLEFGCYEISLGDTIGKGTPLTIKRLISCVKKSIPIEKVAGHYHNTYGMAIANIYASIEEGVKTFDSSIAGLGGCPFAKGATGNVATEDVLYLLEGLGLRKNIPWNNVISALFFIKEELGLEIDSKVFRPLVAGKTF